MSNSTGNNSTSPAIGLSAEQIDTVDKISTVVQILSLLGSLFIIVTYLFLKKHRGALSFVLVFILSSVDLANQITDMLEPSGEQILAMRQAGPPYSVQCYIQSVGQGVLELSSVLWTTAMCATLYAVVEWKWEVRPTCKVLSWLSLVCFGVPIALTIAAGADGALGPSTSWCYVTDAKAYWRWILLYGPLWTAVLFNGIVYGRIYWRLKRTLTTSAQSSATESQASRARIDAVMRRLVWYPAILVVVWFWPTVNRLNEAVTGRQVFALTLLQRTFSSSQGLLNALVSCFSESFSNLVRCNIRIAWLDTISFSSTSSIFHLRELIEPLLSCDCHSSIHSSVRHAGIWSEPRRARVAARDPGPVHPCLLRLLSRWPRSVCVLPLLLLQAYRAHSRRRRWCRFRRRIHRCWLARCCHEQGRGSCKSVQGRHCRRCRSSSCSGFAQRCWLSIIRVWWSKFFWDDGQRRVSTHRAFPNEHPRYCQPQECERLQCFSCVAAAELWLWWRSSKYYIW